MPGNKFEVTQRVEIVNTGKAGGRPRMWPICRRKSDLSARTEVLKQSLTSLVPVKLELVLSVKQRYDLIVNTAACA